MKQCCVKDDTKLFCDRAINCNTMSCYFKEGWVRALPFICCIFSYYLLFQALGIALILPRAYYVHLQQQHQVTWQGRSPEPHFWPPKDTPPILSALFGSSSLASGSLE